MGVAEIIAGVNRPPTTMTPMATAVATRPEIMVFLIPRIVYIKPDFNSKNTPTLPVNLGLSVMGEGDNLSRSYLPKAAPHCMRVRPLP